MPLTTQPFIYEINTWVWLTELAQKLGRPVDLASVPVAEWEAIAAHGFDTVWLMGVWERSPAGKAIASRNPDLTHSFSRCLPDIQDADNVGSAYCIRRYVVDDHLGGRKGLATARQQLAELGLGLLLDFVPNHVAPDAPWIVESPDHFIQGTDAELEAHPGAYLRINDRIFACGRDPYFPAWPDVVQVNAFNPGHRAHVIEILLDIAAQCDGVRCDMAMLLLNDIFVRTWGRQAGQMPVEEYWPLVIEAVHRHAPAFLFLAEAYWDLEWTLQHQGFAFCYDKRLYDLTVHDDAEGIRNHLGGDLAYQHKLVRFIENHDEPRAAAAFSPAKARAAAILVATVPGARLFHEGQLEGRRARVPVFLARRPSEVPDTDVEAFYARLLRTVDAAVFHTGDWALCACSGWPDNQSYRKLGAWCWTLAEDRRLVVLNLSESHVGARVYLPWSDLKGTQWHLVDGLSDAVYDRDGTEMQSEGLYVALTPWSGQIFSMTALR